MNSILKSFVLLVVTVILHMQQGLAQYTVISIPEGTGRGQWTEAQAWEWHKNAGVIKGINQLEPGHPGMTRKDVLQKAAELGYNSVRYFLRGPATEHKEFLSQLLDDAEEAGISVSPVLRLQEFTNRYEGEELLYNAKAYIQGIVYEFRNDARIEIWDVCNEPRDIDIPLAKKAIVWAREAGASQPVTSSAYYWHTYFMDDSPGRRELAAMNDIHNFHSYFFNFNEMEGIEGMVKFMNDISSRPMICSEWLARSQGDGFGRVLPFFAKYQIHWQNWGLYNCDANWSILWEESTFDPHDPWFHEVLHPDGTPYDYREIELIRNFTFTPSMENPDPGIEITDRWSKDRAWMYYVQGPMKGWTFIPQDMSAREDMWNVKSEDQKNWTGELSKLAQSGCDGLRIYTDIASWKAGPEIFLERMDHFLTLADSFGFSVTPVLMTDRDANYPIEEIRKYTHSIVHKFGRDTRIFCWDLYEHPGIMGVDQKLAGEVLLALFRSARFEFPGQPLTATPVALVKEAPENFDFKKALVHGGTPAGWVNMTTTGQTSLEFCAYLWSLSDIISFSSHQPYPETGLLLSVANRYGRPVVCTMWNPPDLENTVQTLDHFGVHHVRWFASPAGSGKYDDNKFRESGIFDVNVLSDNPELNDAINGYHFTRMATKRRIYYEINGVRSVVGR